MSCSPEVCVWTIVTSVRPRGPPGHGLNECLVLVEIPPPRLCFPPLFLTQTLSAHDNPICWRCRVPAKSFTKNSSLYNYVDEELILVSIINMMMQYPMETPDWPALKMDDFHFYFCFQWSNGDWKARNRKSIKTVCFFKVIFALRVLLLVQQQQQ